MLAELAAKPLAERSVIPLAFHVDYWNQLGWRDPFSAAAWSARQRRYGLAFGGGRVYTPELVVAGTADCVGTDRSSLQRRSRRRRIPSARGTLRWAGPAFRDDHGTRSACGK